MARMTPAVVRSLDILELFRAHDGLTGTDVVRLTGFPRASVHELLATLTSRGYLDRDDGVHRLGLAAFVLGQAYAGRLDLREVGLRVARDVARRCEETVNVGILDGPDVVYLVIVDSPHPVRLVSRPGGRLPASCTAIGKALLAFTEPDQIDTLVPDPLPRLTSRSPQDRRVVLKELRHARDAGVAYEQGESSADVSCVGVPVRDHHGEVVAALSISVPDSRWIRRSVAEWTELARAGAAKLSAALGWRG